MFLIDIPFRSCQGRSNRSSIVHTVSYFACHSCFAYDFDFSNFFCACSVNDTACILKNSNIFANSNLYSGPRTDFL
jgi:hypothetical protein